MTEKLGKIDRNNLEELFSDKTGNNRSEIIQGPKFGVDTAIIKLNEKSGLVVASDPTSLIPSMGIRESAWLSVILSANDVATSGFLPQYAQFVLNLPSHISDEELAEYWDNIHHFCDKIGVAITGGHTGFGDIGMSTVSGGVTMFAQAELASLKSTSFTRPNLDLIVTKTAALSSTSILSMSFPNYVAKHLGKQAQQELSDGFYNINILPEVEVMGKNRDVFAKVVSMHDVTEGGVLGAVFEMCEAGSVGVTVDENQIPLGNYQKELCKLFDLDPYRTLGAGSLLIACEKEATNELLQILNDAGINANKIGETLENRNERNVISNGVNQNMFYTDEDPYWNAFFTAMTKKLD